MSVVFILRGGLIALLCCTGLVALNASAGDTPVTLSGTREWRLTNTEGHPYRIMISEPEGELPYTGGYPVLYVLDANAYFASLHEAKRAQKAYRKAIIVGIGYPGDKPLNFLRRSYDFSPPVPEDRNYPPQGGQDQLLDFIERTLMPKVAKHYTVDEDQQSLYGHSFGGMFAVYALFTRPGLFDHIVSASPSLWWHDQYLLPPERRFIKQVMDRKIDVTHTSLALIVAERDSPQEVQNTVALQKRLQPLSAQGLRSSVTVIENEDHMSVPFRIENRVLREVLTARRR